MKVISKGLFRSIRQFRFLEKRLGNGSFGVVRLAVHRATGRLYAIKVIDLANVPSDTELRLVEREIRLHSSLCHPHAITLWDTLSQDGCVYMVLEYAEHGNLFFHQNSKQTFSEAEAALFFSQTARAVEYLHSMDIMHRDLKPENLLLDHAYNIKLCDFGWCAEDIRSSRNTFCGTYEYMAPEMLFHTSYDYRVDLWALGVLLYEMVHGYAPFRGDSVAEVKENMLKGSYELSDNFSEGLKQLITAILKFDPNERVSIKEMLSSSWLQDMQLLLEDCTAQLEDGTPSQLHSLLAHAEFVPKTPNHKQNSTSKQTASKEQTGSKDVTNSKGISTKKDRNPTRNISFNLSINNFAYIKNTDRTNFNSPAQAFLEKKKKKEKEQKRCHTQAENQLMELAHSLSPQGRKAPTRRDPKLKPEKQQKRKGVQRQRGRKSQQLSEKSPFRTMEQSEFSGRTPSKLGSILKKRSVHQKLSSAVSSMKSLHRVKTGQRGNITNVSSLHY